MRIRKHAKISPAIYADSSLGHRHGKVIQAFTCELNQSPWDVMTYPISDPETPPPPLVYQADEDDDYMANETFADCIRTDQGAPSMKFEMGDEMQKWGYDVGIPPAERFDNGGTEMEQEVHKGGEITLCCKSDGKKWKCRRKAKEGHTFCEHHLSQVRTSNRNLPNSSGKKLEKPLEYRRRPRAKKPTLSSNPNEYYYYSGFGPRWGKKRGSATKAKPYMSTDGSSSKASRKDLEVAEPNIPETNNNNAPKAAKEGFPSLAESSQMDNSEGFVYIEEDDEEENEDEDYEIVQAKMKRARKPIKARTLKSLM